MSVSLFKTVLWLAALGITGYLGWFLYETKQTWADDIAALTQAEQQEALDVEAPPQAERDDLVDYELVRLGMISLDWTGAPPPPPPIEVPEDTGPREVPKTPVADLLKVYYIHQDGRYPEESYALIEYKDSQLAAAARAGQPRSNAAAEKIKLSTGDHLPAPHDGISVARVLATGIVFAFEDGREEEVVGTIELERGSGIVLVPDGESARVPSPIADIPESAGDAPFVPRNTTKLGDNRYRVGTEDARRIGEGYTEILTTEVRHRRWRNPRTGQYEGIEVTDVVAGGVAAAHGVQSGDVIKSINGHPVSSVSEAITYVKNNSEATTVWEVVVVNKGIETTMIFETPPEQ